MVGQEEEEEEDEGYRQLEGDLVTVTLQHNNYGLGISLAGHKGTLGDRGATRATTLCLQFNLS